MNPEFCLFEATNSKVQLGGDGINAPSVPFSERKQQEIEKLFQNNSG